MSIAFGNRLRELRNGRKLLQEDLADEFKISKSAIGMYERGEREPNFDLLDEMSTFFGVTKDYLLGSSDLPHLTEAQSKSLRTIKDIRNEIANDLVLDIDSEPFTPQAKEEYLRQIDLLIRLREVEGYKNNEDDKNKK